NCNVDVIIIASLFVCTSYFFFFSSRRRHTRSKRDWSSDVCSSDLTIPWKPDGTGGATCTCNLAPLCRTHHRLKTHGDNAPTANGEHTIWSYTSLGGGEYHWKG